jgi:PKD repeat protein
LATYQNLECVYIGCTNSTALNFNPQANQEDGSCEFLSAQINVANLAGCPPFQFAANSINNEYPGSSCAFSINGEQVSDVCSTAFEYEFIEPGIYEFNYTLSVGNAIDDTTITIEVFAEPNQPEIVYDSETHFLNCLNCDDENLEWQLNGETIDDASSNSLNAEFDGITQNGDYQLISTNSNSCSISSDILTVVQPHLAVSAPGGCIPFSVYLINTTDLLPGMTCSLNTGNTIIENFDGLIEVTFEEEGVYLPVITCALGESSGVATETITAYALEIPILSIDDSTDAIICENYLSFTEFIWNVDGVVINGGISQPAGNSVYQLQAYNDAGCGGSNLFIAISTEEIQDTKVHAYPNPANDFLQVESAKPSAIRIMNNLSQVVFESSKTSFNHSISTSVLPSGLYFLQWSDDAEWHTVKFEVNH